jgi:hypothetical protein
VLKGFSSTARLTPDPVDYLFFFPRALGPLCRLEPALRHVPFGAQYLVIGRRQESA